MPILFKTSPRFKLTKKAVSMKKSIDLRLKSALKYDIPRIGALWTYLGSRLSR